MSIYQDSEYPVSEEVATVHASHLEQLGEAGAWGTGAQRIAVAQEARQAGYDAGVLEVPVQPGGSSAAKLPEAARRFVRKLAVSPKDISKDDYDAVRRGGLGDAEYVEIVGIVSRLTDLDVFARGIGVPLRPLPEPRAGEPSRHRPEAAKQELAWVPSVPNPPEGGALADELYRGKPTPYIVRGLSLVPDEVRRLLELERVQYILPRQILNLDAEVEGPLTRAQIEVIAGRVSAINECFFWTSGHAWFLRESGHRSKLTVNLQALIDPTLDVGVPGGAALLAFSDAVLGPDRGTLDAARATLARELGPAAVSRAAAVAANFTKNDRTANAVGAPLEPEMLKATKAIREELGLNSFRSAASSLLHFPGA